MGEGLQREQGARSARRALVQVDGAHHAVAIRLDIDVTEAERALAQR